jgi:hypothetical protein
MKEAKNGTGHPLQTPPPLPLTGPGLHTGPTPEFAAMGDGMGDFGDGRAEPSPVTGRFQTMNTAAAGTAQAPEENGIGTTGKIGENKAMPPQRLTATRAPGGLDPGKIFPQTRNLIDVDDNRYYQ